MVGKGAMLEWVEKDLKPFVVTAPGNIILLHMLDSYQCHIIALVVSSIQQLGMEVDTCLVDKSHFVSLLMLELIGH